jgi:hypothetical protein
MVNKEAMVKKTMQREIARFGCAIVKVEVIQ